MKRFKFEMGGSYTFFTGENLGKAIEDFTRMYPKKVKYIETITEAPIQEYEKP